MPADNDRADIRVDLPPLTIVSMAYRARLRVHRRRYRADVCIDLRTLPIVFVAYVLVSGYRPDVRVESCTLSVVFVSVSIVATILTSASSRIP